MKDIEDDGRVISSMDFEGITGGKPPFFTRRFSINRKFGMDVSNKERIAMIKAAYKTVLPIAFGFIALFFIAFLLIDLLWLS